jgi:tetratricopeptide (TPR) repeat protein
MRRLTHARSKVKALVCATILAAATSALANDGETRSCETKFGGQVVCGDLVIGITLEQYKADLNKRAEDIRAEEAEKHAQLQKLVELTERATSAEKDSLRNQIAAVEAEKRALEAEGKGVADRLANLQASYDGLVQKLAEANAALQAFAPLISKDAFEQAQGMLSRGDVLGAEGKFVEIANTVAKIREQADVVEARAIFQAGELAEQRIDWREASAHYARAAKLQPSNWRYAQKAGSLADDMGDYPAAGALNEATLTLTTSEFGPDSKETATALNNLALSYSHLARYAEAEPLFRRAIEIDEKALGKEHGATYNNLAVLLQVEGKYAEAEPLFRRAIEIDERALGKEHGATYNNLAVLLQVEGKYAEAEPLFRRAIEIDEKALGKEHPDVARDYNNLALFLQGQGKYAEAEPLYRRAIEIDEKALGMDHPNIAVWYTNVAEFLEDQGKYAEAERFLRRAIEIGEKTLGKEHPTVATRYNNLAFMLEAQGKYAEAEPLYRRAIEVDEKALGREHPSVARDYNNLAFMLQDQGKYAEAEPLYRRAIDILQASLGPEHPKTLTAKTNYDSLRQLIDQKSGNSDR